MPKQKLQKQETGFAQVKNEILKNENLSWKAKGIFAYLYSKPDDWDFSIKRITEECNNGEWTTRTGLQELEDANYLVREKQKSGKVIYFIYYKPDVKNQHLGKKPDVENRNMQKPQSAKINTISNKEKKVTKSINNKDIDTNVSSNVNVAGKDINALIELFKPVNPSYERLFKNTTQRKCLTRLVEKHGLEKTRATIKALPQIIEKKYAPRITTPYQLEKKLGDLVVFWKQNKDKKPNTIKIS